MSNTYWFDKPQLAELEGVMLTGVRAISKSEAVDIMNKQQEQINRFVDKVISQQEKIDALTQDKHAIITNHLNVLSKCIMAVPVPERDREANIKMRDAILNVMARSVVAYQVEPADLKNEAGEALRQAIQAKQLTSASSMRVVCMLSL
jgi:hypothetical protein